MRIHKAVVRAISVVGLFIMGAVPTCYATVVPFTNRATWGAASSNVTTIDFNNLTAAAAGQYPFVPTLTTGGVTFATFYNAGTSNDIVIKNEENWGTGNYLLGPSQDPGVFHSLKITLPNPVTSFGTDIMYNGNYEGTFQVSLSTGEILTTATTLPSYASRAFFGFTTDTAVSFLIFTPTYVFSTEPRLVIDNVSFGDAGGVTVETPTPETATLVLCGAGLILLHTLRRRGAVAAQAT